MKKHKQNIIAVLSVVAALLVIAGGFKYLAPYIHFQNTGPSQAEWDKKLGTPTNKTLFGRVLVRDSGSLQIFAQETGVGTTTVTTTASTTVVRDTPLSPQEMQAAYQEYKKREAEAGGKPFQSPETMKIETLTFGDIQAGDLLLITLTPDSTKDHFVAQGIEVVPPTTILPVAPGVGGGMPAPLP